ncbi:Uncharacterised protein [Bordetella pertussis]|nr:Uncharacterised protein [Bordetella pertussis]
MSTAVRLHAYGVERCAAPAVLRSCLSAIIPTARLSQCCDQCHMVHSAPLAGTSRPSPAATSNTKTRRLTVWMERADA